MPFINCKITLQLTCSKKSVLVAGTVANQVPKFRITNTTLYVPPYLQEKYKTIKTIRIWF